MSDFDLGVIHAVDNRKSSEVFTPVLFHPEGGISTFYDIKGKVDTVVSCMPTSMLSKNRTLQERSKTKQHHYQRNVWSRSSDCGFVDITVTSNDITAKSRFTKQACAFILGFGFCKEFKLVTIAPCAYNNTYLWSHAMSWLYTSLKNQRPTTKIAGFTLDISSKLEVYFKCTWDKPVRKQVLFHLNDHTSSPQKPQNLKVPCCTLK